MPLPCYDAAYDDVDAAITRYYYHIFVDARVLRCYAMHVIERAMRAPL